MAKMNANRPEGGAVEGARKQLDVLRAFVVEHKLATIPVRRPGRAWTRRRRTRRRISPTSTRPGPYDDGMPSTYYIAPPDPSWPQAEQDAYTPGVADLMSTSVHEVWPGHFLQFLHSNRSASAIGRLFLSYAFAEGWAHYAEEMMWEAGLTGDLAGGRAEYRVGQINKALYRNVRYICAIGMHTQGMKVEECETHVPRAGLPGPGQCAPAGGARHLRSGLPQLHARQADDPQAARRLDAKSRGGREGWKEFHDTFLSFGGPPVPMSARGCSAKKRVPRSDAAP